MSEKLWEVYYQVNFLIFKKEDNTLTWKVIVCLLTYKNWSMKYMLTRKYQQRNNVSESYKSGFQRDGRRSMKEESNEH
jgi:hypothetical protein